MKKNVRQIVYEYKTRHKFGFTREEMEEVVAMFPDLNRDKFDDAMFGNTCMLIGEDIITYHCDLELALRCGIENRNMYVWEWD